MIFTPLDTVGVVRRFPSDMHAPGVPFGSTRVGVVVDVRQAQGEEVHAFGPHTIVEVVQLGFFGTHTFHGVDAFVTVPAPLVTLCPTLGVA